MKTIDRFIQFCESTDAAFGCFDYFDRSEDVRYKARIKHLLQDGASHDSLKKLSKRITDPGNHVRDFFTCVDGAFLFVDAINGYRPFELCSIPDWHVATHAMRKWYLTKDAVFRGNIDFLTDGFAIATINQTPDFISIVTKGPNAGKIYHVAHDDFQYEPLAQNFEEFIDQMIEDPPAFLERIGAFAFYSDGETDTKWIPKEYMPC